jgi:hypothetical protein
MAAPLLSLLNFTTPQAGRGRPLAASAPAVTAIQQPCYPTAQRWPRPDLIPPASRYPVQNCTIRRVEPGHLPVVSIMQGLGTQRPCYRTAWCWRQGDQISLSLTQARNCTAVLLLHLRPHLQLQLHLRLLQLQRERRQLLQPPPLRQEQHRGRAQLPTRARRRHRRTVRRDR